MIALYLTPNDSITESLAFYPIETCITVYLSKGIYREKLLVYHHHLRIIGESTNETIITFDDYSYKMHADGLLYNTFRTSTLTVFGDHVHLHNLTIRNEAGSSPLTGQAIALSLYGNHSMMSSCVIDGHQDTLFLGPLPDDLILRYTGFLLQEQLIATPLNHTFDACTIKGDVDYIFGSGTAYFHRCHIISKAKGFVCAPSTNTFVPYGLVFYQSLIENQSNDPIHLARPWRAHGSVIFIECDFKGVISQARYDNWNQKYMRFRETPYIQSFFSLPLEKEIEEQLINQLSKKLLLLNEKIKN